MATSEGRLSSKYRIDVQLSLTTRSLIARCVLILQESLAGSGHRASWI